MNGLEVQAYLGENSPVTMTNIITRSLEARALGPAALGVLRVSTRVSTAEHRQRQAQFFSYQN